MSPATRLYFKVVTGISVESGFGLYGITADGDGSSDSHAQLGCLAGEGWYQDINLSVSQINDPASIPVFHREDATAEWRRNTATSFPILVNGSNILEWNNPDIYGDWGLEAINDGYYMLIHIFLTNDDTDPYIAIVGQAKYSTADLAYEGAKVEIASILASDLPMSGAIPVGSVMFQGDSAYTNSVNARIVSVKGADYLDWVPTLVRDHRNLTGAGTNTHDEIDTHLASTSNPHSVTTAQLSLYEALMVQIELTVDEQIQYVAPFDMTITGWTMLLDASGSAAIDVWKDTYANHPPTDADSIVTPSVSSAQKNQATGLSITVTKGDILIFNVDSVTTATLATLALTGVRT